MFKKQIVHPVDIQTIELQIFSPATPEDVIDEFYRFGTVLFSECIQRGSELDRKLTNMLGWSTAALAFLLLNHSRTANPEFPWKLALVIATASAFLSILIASFALKTIMWPAPSEEDWFRDGLWNNVKKLKRYHVVSLLLTHQAQIKRAAFKANCLRYVEVCLSITALTISSVLLFS